MSLEEAIDKARAHESYKGKSLKTVGELKKALAAIPDETPLAFDDHGFGYRAWVFLSQHRWVTGQGIGYYSKDDPEKGLQTTELPQEVCVIEPTHL
jgi:hypothetical protein